MNIVVDHRNLGSKDANLPLCVDLDGTLIAGDLLHESVFLLLKLNLFYLFLLPFWLLKGKPHLKTQIARRVQPDARNLPYNGPLIAWLRQEKNTGRKLILATASHETIANDVASHLNLFDEVEATSDETNLSGAAKAQRLEEIYGFKGFDYVGNAKDDIKVWDRANNAIAVGEDTAIRNYCKQNHAKRFASTSKASGLSPIKVWMKAIRVHQWLKNSLLFVPIVLGSRLLSITTAVDLSIAFFAFSFCASSVYLLNDLIDIDVDRRHKTKCKRPLAAGQISVSHASAASAALLVSAVALSSSLPLEFTAVLILYFVVTTAYTFFLKSFLLIDVLTLAGLFTLRVLAGSAAVESTVSAWLLAFCMFFFLSLALVKRFVEISTQLGGTSRETSGRGYQPVDLETLGQAGLGAGFAAVVVLALFIDSPAIAENYLSPQLIWLVCPLVLYLLIRIWILARRNQMNDDPVVFLMTDWRSQTMIAIGAVLMLMSQNFSL